MTRGSRILAALLVAAVAAEWLAAPPHHFPGFHALVGLAAAFLLGLGAKAAGRAFLQRPEEGEDA